MRLVGLVACVAMLAGGALASRALAGPQPGDKAPDFSLRDRQQRVVRLSDLAYAGPARPGRPKRDVVLDFFRTDCMPCRKELPQLVAYYRAHKHEAVVLLVALLEPEGGREKLDAFLRDHPLPFPVLVDSYEVAAKHFIVKKKSLTLPCIFQISKDGRVLKRIEGLTTDLKQVLRPGAAPGAGPGVNR